tara:strand:+ start:161 stop:433 length:273 start_codon:yes stop_codon:yes gene_type:complete
MIFIKLALVGPLIFYMNVMYSENLKTETHTNLIIKNFCKENVKSEFKRNNFDYKDSIGENVCNCYLKNISKNISHEKAISKCKFGTFKNN